MTEAARYGAIPTGDGVRFTVRSSGATAVELCLYDRPDGEATQRLALEPAGEGTWSVFVSGLAAGQLYGYRVDGPFDPSRGQRFNRAKLLLDPWGRGVTGEPLPEAALSAGEEDPDERDSAFAMPRSVVVEDAFDWQSVSAPEVPWSRTVLYEAHVRGLTARHPEVPPELRGTYAALSHGAVLQHLLALGITTLELMPVQQIGTERWLAAEGRSNYFGYSPIGHFAPHAAYASAGWRGATLEFKTMVRELHRAGIEVILDVVFNHTPEGDHRGPTLSLRGFDNSTWYRLDTDDARRYVDFTGCGNTLDFSRPEVRQWALDCLCYWREEMHIDGFRFDLAPVLGRSAGTEGADFDSEAAFFGELSERASLRSAKLIAEPWDTGPSGYRLGAFPTEWSEWNDRFRDDVRAFWRGDRHTAPAFREAFVASPSIFRSQRRPHASIHYVASHDGFTLGDLVSYDRKHNWENGEDNRDGHRHNLSRNWGSEGATSDPRILDRRDRVRRALLASVVLARGVPMLGHGDELGRTHRGNNNPYCHDSELTWLDWEGADRRLLAFTERLFELRREHEALRRDQWPTPEESRWVALHGGPLGATPLQQQEGSFGLLLAGPPRLLLVFNQEDAGRYVRPPRPSSGLAWHRVLDTDDPERVGRIKGRSFILAPHSLVVLEERSPGSGDSPERISETR